MNNNLQQKPNPEQLLQNEIYALGRVIAQYKLAVDQMEWENQQLVQEVDALKARIQVLEGGADAAH